MVNILVIDILANRQTSKKRISNPNPRKKEPNSMGLIFL
jgi:hypothetical protein